MARLRATIVTGCCVVLLNLAGAYVPDHVKRQLLAPNHDVATKSSSQHVAYQDVDSNKHLALDYQAQQHTHVQVWTLDSIEGLVDVKLRRGTVLFCDCTYAADQHVHKAIVFSNQLVRQVSTMSKVQST